jgi:hypothetical protein
MRTADGLSRLEWERKTRAMISSQTTEAHQKCQDRQLIELFANWHQAPLRLKLTGNNVLDQASRFAQPQIRQFWGFFASRYSQRVGQSCLQLPPSVSCAAAWT